MTTPNVAVRAADVRDVEGIVRLAGRVQSMHAAAEARFVEPDATALTEFFRERLTDGSVVLVACAPRAGHQQGTDEVVGYLFAQLDRRPPSIFQRERSAFVIQQIAVDESHRRAGIGSLLLSEALTTATDLGATSVTLDSWAFNTSAHEFFASHGFRPLLTTFERVEQ